VGEPVAELGLATARGVTLDVLAGTIYAHPTLSESTMEAAAHGLGRAILTQNLS
jgi:dihydrolipoamide dehydrogenase